MTDPNIWTTEQAAMKLAARIAEQDAIIKELVEALADYEDTLDEVASGAPWGGPPLGHINFMRSIAAKSLDKWQDKIAKITKGSG